MNLRISALEKVARIGCKYDLFFLLYSCWALPSGGFAEGQLALASLPLWLFAVCVNKCQVVPKLGRPDVACSACTQAGFREPGSSVNLCRSSDNKGCVSRTQAA